MNTNGSRNWLLWLAIILGIIAVAYFVRMRMQKPAVSEVAVVTVEDMDMNVDALPAQEQPEVAPESAE